MYALGFPRLYLQGYGIFDTLGAAVQRFGQRPLVIADEFVLGLLGERMEKTFADADLHHTVLRFAGECSPSQIESLSAQATTLGSDVIVGTGGGKTLDLTKGVARSLNLPLVIVPTLASNDAPTSRVIVTYTDEGEFIGPLFLNLNPDCIFVDSQIVSQAPARFFACGIADALATYYEAEQCLKSGVDNFYNGKQTLTARAIAKTCHETIWTYAREAMNSVRRKECTETVEKVIEANILLSGLGFEGCGVAAAHAVGLSLSVLEPAFGDAKGIMHGEEVALGIVAQFVLEGRSEQEIDALHDFYLDLGLPVSFSQVGILDFTPEKMRLVAEAACKPKSRIWNMAMPISVERVMDVLRIVGELGDKKLRSHNEHS